MPPRTVVSWVEDHRLMQSINPKTKRGSLLVYPEKEKSQYLRLAPGGDVAVHVDEALVSGGFRRYWRRCGFWVEHDGGVTVLFKLQPDSSEPVFTKYEG